MLAYSHKYSRYYYTEKNFTIDSFVVSVCKLYALPAVKSFLV